MKPTKFIHLAVALLFIYFSYVQLNDIDGWKWILLYSSIAFLAFLKFAQISLKYVPGIIVLITLVLLIANINLFTSWTNAGRPAFIDYEPTNIQEVENIREFLGLCITFATALIYFLLLQKK